jgi:hypothetical protein
MPRLSTPEFGTLVLEASTGADQVSALLQDLSVFRFLKRRLGADLKSSALYDVNSLVQEIAQGADTVSAFIQIGNVVSEAAQAADLVSGGVLFGSAIVESATGAEEISALVILIPASIAESATGAELISTIATLNIPVLEGATASEQNIALVVFNSSILESADMADEISRRLLWEIINTADDVRPGMSLQQVIRGKKWQVHTQPT